MLAHVAVCNWLGEPPIRTCNVFLPEDYDMAYDATNDAAAYPVLRELAAKELKGMYPTLNYGLAGNIMVVSVTIIPESNYTKLRERLRIYVSGDIPAVRLDYLTRLLPEASLGMSDADFELLVRKMLMQYV